MCFPQNILAYQMETLSETHGEKDIIYQDTDDSQDFSIIAEKQEKTDLVQSVEQSNNNQLENDQVHYLNSQELQSMNMQMKLSSGKSLSFTNNTVAGYYCDFG